MPSVGFCKRRLDGGSATLWRCSHDSSRRKILQKRLSGGTAAADSGMQRLQTMRCGGSGGMPVIAPAYSTWMLNSLNIGVARFRKALSRWNTAILYFLPFPRHDLAKRCRGTSVWQPCSWAVVDNGALKRVRCRGMPLSRHFRGTCLDRAQRGVEKWQLSLTISGCRNIHSMHQAAAHSVMTRARMTDSVMKITACRRAFGDDLEREFIGNGNMPCRATWWGCACPTCFKKRKLDIPMWVATASIAHQHSR